MAIVPIIIPFYKEHEKLRKCRAAIDAQSYPGCETFVRDNTHDNILYTAAINEGLAKYCYRDDVQYVVVLNQDANMHKDCVRHLVAFMEANPECGIACPLQYQEKAGAMSWGGPGAPLAISSEKVVTWGGSQQAFPTGVHRCDPFASYTAPLETYWANGACMMIRVQAVRECGLFDKNMRFVCSDADFSFTARARGWKVFVVPQALCEHSLGASGKLGNPMIDTVKLRDIVYFTQKWLTDGLYRQLAVEGPELSSIGVRQVLRRYQWTLAGMERKLGERPPSHTEAYPSWLTEMHISPEIARKAGF